MYRWVYAICNLDTVIIYNRLLERPAIIRILGNPLAPKISRPIMRLLGGHSISRSSQVSTTLITEACISLNL